MLIFLFGSGTLALYHVMAMEDQLDDVTRAVDQMDGKVKRAQYEKAKFYGIARDLLQLAPKNPKAEQVVVDFKLRQLQAAQPELMAPAPPAAPNAFATNAAPTQPVAPTNSAPAQPSQDTHTAPVHSSSPATK